MVCHDCGGDLGCWIDCIRATWERLNWVVKGLCGIAFVCCLGAIAGGIGKIRIPPEKGIPAAIALGLLGCLGLWGWLCSGLCKDAEDWSECWHDCVTGHCFAWGHDPGG